MTTQDRLQELLRDVLADDTFVMTRETTAADHEDWDSLAQITIIVAIEKEFGIRFALNEVEGLRNVGDTIDLIEKKLGRQPSGDV